MADKNQKQDMNYEDQSNEDVTDIGGQGQAGGQSSDTDSSSNMGNVDTEEDDLGTL